MSYNNSIDLNDIYTIYLQIHKSIVKTPYFMKNKKNCFCNTSIQEFLLQKETLSEKFSNAHNRKVNLSKQVNRASLSSAVP